MQAVAYIRRSARSRSDPGDLSREFQIEKVRELAGPDGPALHLIDADWGRSAATDKTDKCTAFLALLDKVERGEVAVLYAYATDRLARSVEWAARLLNGCRRAGTVIVTSEGRFEPDNLTTDQLFYFQAMQNEGYSKQAEVKRRATVERQRRRGDKLGPAFYGAKPGESLPAVLAAFEEAGSAHGTATLLNERGVPTRRGGTWTHAAVRQILAREGLVSKYGVQGAKPKAPFVLYRLLRCHCGRTLSGVRVTKGRNGKPTEPRVLYRCIGGSTDPNHGVKSIAESKVLPWVVDQVARVQPPDAILASEEAERKRADLDAQRVRVLDMYQLGADRDDVARRLAAVDDELERLQDEARAVVVPQIDWSWEPAALNELLRILFVQINVGPDLRPVSAVWRNPSMAPEG